ncbi:MAG: hypothetical protein RMJ98_05300, partial [Myxococcales bacterium]|nr:hypothetical protein [Myxococcales bacterium]
MKHLHLFTTLLVVFAPVAAQAQQPPRFALASFEPSLPGDRFFSVPDASVRLDTLPLGRRRGGPLGTWLAGAAASLEVTSGLLVARGSV